MIQSYSSCTTSNTLSASITVLPTYSRAPEKVSAHPYLTTVAFLVLIFQCYCIKVRAEVGEVDKIDYPIIFKYILFLYKYDTL